MNNSHDPNDLGKQFSEKLGNWSRSLVDAWQNQHYRNGKIVHTHNA